ncbi:putative pyruvate kinase [Helianthus anomalus]
MLDLLLFCRQSAKIIVTCNKVHAAIKVKASVIICFTSTGRAARCIHDMKYHQICKLIAKYMTTMPVLSVVIPHLKTNQLRWTTTGAYEARKSLIIRGLFPMLADPRHVVRNFLQTESTGATNETVLKVALDHGRNIGVIKPHDRVVGCQKVGDDFVVKIIELENTS